MAKKKRRRNNCKSSSHPASPSFRAPAGRPIPWSARTRSFEDLSIPRGTYQYLKVVYDVKFPVSEQHVYKNGGRTFERILGAGAINLENFLIKRRLMGPDWVQEDPTFGMRDYQDRATQTLNETNRSISMARLVDNCCWRSNEFFFEVDDRYWS